MARMMDPTVIPALALAASLEELASMLERTTDLEYLVPRSTGRGREEGAGGTIGAHVAHCVRQVSAVLSDAGADRPRGAHGGPASGIAGAMRAGRRALRSAQHAVTDGPAEVAATVAIEHSRRRGLSALRAVIADLEAAAACATAEPLMLQPRRDPTGDGLLRSAATGRGLALLLPQVRHHKAQVGRVLALATCAS